jgi:hypothetical protein
MLLLWNQQAPLMQHYVLLTHIEVRALMQLHSVLQQLLDASAQRTMHHSGKFTVYWCSTFVVVE